MGVVLVNKRRSLDPTLPLGGHQLSHGHRGGQGAGRFGHRDRANGAEEKPELQLRGLPK